MILDSNNTFKQMAKDLFRIIRPSTTILRQNRFFFFLMVDEKSEQVDQ